MPSNLHMMLTELKTMKRKEKAEEERVCRCIELNNADQEHALYAVHSASAAKRHHRPCIFSFQAFPDVTILCEWV